MITKEQIEAQKKPRASEGIEGMKEISNTQISGKINMSEYIGPRKDRFWTDDKTKKLKLYFDKDWSVRQIADGLGCSRNMIIGKIYRMRGKEGGHKMFPVRAPQPSGGRPKGSRNGPHVAQRRPVRYNPTLATIAKPTGPVPIALFKSTGSNGGKKTVGDLIMQLTNDSCRWPEGDPFKDDFSYCGHRVKEGSPYCEHHFEVARVPRVHKGMKGSQTNWKRW